MVPKEGIVSRSLRPPAASMPAHNAARSAAGGPQALRVGASVVHLLFHLWDASRRILYVANITSGHSRSSTTLLLVGASRPRGVSGHAEEGI